MFYFFVVPHAVAAGMLRTEGVRPGYMHALSVHAAVDSFAEAIRPKGKSRRTTSSPPDPTMSMHSTAERIGPATLGPPRGPIQEQARRKGKSCNVLPCYTRPTGSRPPHAPCAWSNSVRWGHPNDLNSTHCALPTARAAAWPKRFPA